MWLSTLTFSCVCFKELYLLIYENLLIYEKKKIKKGRGRKEKWQTNNNNDNPA